MTGRYAQSTEVGSDRSRVLDKAHEERKAPQVRRHAIKTG